MSYVLRSASTYQSLNCGCVYQDSARCVTDPPTRISTCAACAQYDRERAEHRSQVSQQRLARVAGEKEGGAPAVASPSVHSEAGAVSFEAALLAFLAFVILFLLAQVAAAIIRIGAVV